MYVYIFIDLVIIIISLQAVHYRQVSWQEFYPDTVRSKLVYNTVVPAKTTDNAGLGR